MAVGRLPPAGRGPSQAFGLAWASFPILGLIHFCTQYSGLDFGTFIYPTESPVRFALACGGSGVTLYRLYSAH